MTKEQKRFIELIGTAANLFYNKGVRVLPSLVIAMAIKESNWGKSKLSTCLDVVKEGNNTWLKIPSGFICAVFNDKIYVGGK